MLITNGPTFIFAVSEFSAISARSKQRQKHFTTEGTEEEFYC